MNVGLEHCAGRAALLRIRGRCRRRFLMVGAPPMPPIIWRRAAEAMLVYLIAVLHFHALHDFAIG